MAARSAPRPFSCAKPAVGLRNMHLVIIIDIPMFFFDDTNWGNWMEDINKGQYEFVAILHWSGIDIYDFVSRTYYTKRIEREDMDALKKLGRLTAEGIIKDDDPVWNE